MTGTSPMTKRRMSVLRMKLPMQEKNFVPLKITNKHCLKQKDFMNYLSQLIFPKHNLFFNLGKPHLILSMGDHLWEITVRHILTDLQKPFQMTFVKSLPREI